MANCSIPECEKPSKTKGLCGMHYTRQSRYGTTDEPPKRGKSREEMEKMRALRRPNTQITCGHPWRKHGGRGMCASCFTIDWMKKNPGRSGNDWLKNHPERAKELRRRGLLKLYGMTPEGYDAMWTEQGGKCANPACDFTADRVMTNYSSGLHIDHCHGSRKVRGLLCGPCNLALGQVNDDVNRLLGLVRYLESHALT